MVNSLLLILYSRPQRCQVAEVHVVYQGKLMTQIHNKKVRKESKEIFLRISFVLYILVLQFIDHKIIQNECIF